MDQLLDPHRSPEHPWPQDVKIPKEFPNNQGAIIKVHSKIIEIVCSPALV